MNMRSEPRRQVVCKYFYNPSERVTFAMAGIDLSDHGGGSLRVMAAHRISVECLDIVRQWKVGVIRNAHRPNSDGMGDQPNAADLFQKCSCDRSQCGARGCFAGGCAF